MPFTDNKSFKKNPRLIIDAKWVYLTNHEGKKITAPKTEKINKEPKIVKKDEIKVIKKTVSKKKIVKKVVKKKTITKTKK